MNSKRPRIREWLEPFENRGIDPHYLAFFDRFNRQQFFEAHEVLEELWLADRQATDADFFKGLIQLAGAFVHVQKGRLNPALALLRLASSNLGKYESPHWGLNLSSVQGLIASYRDSLSRHGLATGVVFPRLAPEQAAVS